MKAGFFAIAAICLSAGNAQADTATQRDKVIADAAPYVAVALTRPTGELYEAAQSLKAGDALRFGLALFAGRTPELGLPDEDMAVLKAMEARIVPLAEAYMVSHPHARMSPAAWRKILQVSDEELAMVNRYQTRLMGDYWLFRAGDDVQVLRGEKLARLEPGRLGGNSNAGQVVGSVSFSREIPIEIFITANHCVHAVREAVGLRYYRPGELPLSIRLLWNYPSYDAEGWIERNNKDGKISGYAFVPLGAAACGTQAQFDAYVADLKASVGS